MPPSGISIFYGNVDCVLSIELKVVRLQSYFFL